MNSKKIGIIGCSEIVARAIINPLKTIHDMEVYAIASRDPDKAAMYAQKYSISNVFRTYRELLDSPEIDIIYIALPNHLHTRWIIESLEAGKHVLSEKPLCLNSAEAQAINEVYRKTKGIHLLEGIMVAHHPWQRRIKDMINSNIYGKLRSIDSQISFLPKNNFSNNYRSEPDKGGGSFFDLGCYWLQFIQHLAGLEDIEYEGSSLFDGPNRCDWEFDAYIRYSDGMKASFSSSFRKQYQASHILQFDDADVSIDDFFRANLGEYKITVHIAHHNGDKNKIVFEPQNYYANQLRFLSDVIDGKQDNISLSESFERIIISENIFNKAKSLRRL